MPQVLTKYKSISPDKQPTT